MGEAALQLAWHLKHPLNTCGTFGLLLTIHAAAAVARADLAVEHQLVRPPQALFAGRPPEGVDDQTVALQGNNVTSRGVAPTDWTLTWAGTETTARSAARLLLQDCQRPECLLLAFWTYTETRHENWCNADIGNDLDDCYRRTPGQQTQAACLLTGDEHGEGRNLARSTWLADRISSYGTADATFC